MLIECSGTASWFCGTEVGLNKLFILCGGSLALHIAFQVLTAGSESTKLSCNVLVHELFNFYVSNRLKNLKILFQSFFLLSRQFVVLNFSLRQTNLLEQYVFLKMGVELLTKLKMMPDRVLDGNSELVS